MHDATITQGSLWAFPCIFWCMMQRLHTALFEHSMIRPQRSQVFPSWIIKDNLLLLSFTEVTETLFWVETRILLNAHSCMVTMLQANFIIFFSIDTFISFCWFLSCFFFIQSGELSGGDHVSRQVTQEVFISPRLIRRCLLKFTLGKTYWLYFRIPQPLNGRHFPFGKRCGSDSRIGVVAILSVVVALSN